MPPVQYIVSLAIDAGSAYTVSVDLRHARTFVTVAEVGTVSKAAVRLHVAQPALSLAAKLRRRAERAGVPEELFADDGAGSALFALVRRMRAEGRDPEAELRAASRRFRDRVEGGTDSAR